VKALEFTGKVLANGTIVLPDNVKQQIPPGIPVRVLILIPEESAEEEAWARLALEEFFAGYGEADAIYDRLAGSEDVPAR